MPILHSVQKKNLFGALFNYIIFTARLHLISEESVVVLVFVCTGTLPLDEIEMMLMSKLHKLDQQIVAGPQYVTHISIKTNSTVMVMFLSANIQYLQQLMDHRDHKCKHLKYLPAGLKQILHQKYTYYQKHQFKHISNFPAHITMLVPLGTGKSILWLGIISAQCNTTAITADKKGIERSPSRPVLNTLLKWRKVSW